MRWKGRRASTNIEDRRGGGVQKAAGGGVILFILAAVVYFMGGDPTPLLQEGLQQTQAGASGGSTAPSDPAEDELAQFTAVVLADTESAWERVFTAGGAAYSPPIMVLFRDRVQSACGTQSAAVGPFYCPGDRKVYLDLGFFDQLHRRFGAPGDFAQAYVIAHEVGHHVQNLLGIDRAAQQLGRGVSGTDRNAISVLQELQADCFAGIWAHHAAQQRDFLEHGDLEEALRAAAAIGDDAIQGRGGAVRPETFTHGSSRQRVDWFRRGMEGGAVGACDTFGAAGVDLPG